MERRLAAILHAAVQGDSRLMGADDEATVSHLTALREPIGSHVRQRRGRVVDAAGDGEPRRRGGVMSTRLIGAGWLVALILAGCASSEKPVGVRVVDEENLVRGCRVLGTVADNDLEDLQKKAARLGGNVVLLTPQRKSKGGYFGLQDYMTADVYQCQDGSR